MRALLVALVVSALVVPVATAGTPYSFSNRAAFEKYAASQFVRTTKHRYVVRSIGCAKSGVGRGDCAVVAFNSRAGLSRFELSIVCASDAGNDCTAYVRSWSAGA